MAPAGQSASVDFESITFRPATEHDRDVVRLLAEFDSQPLPAEHWREVEPAEFVVVEGVTATRGAFRLYLTLAVWVETPREHRVRRGSERDGDGALALWRELMAREDEYVAREQPQRNAQVLVNGTQ
jgi:uridine kinase